MARPTPSPANRFWQKLPDIVDFCRVYLGVDPITQMMPIQPTAHYTMGGIPTNKYGEVVIDDKNTVFPGLVCGGRMRLCLGARRRTVSGRIPCSIWLSSASTRDSRPRSTRNRLILRNCPPTRKQARGPSSRRCSNGSGKENAFDISTEMKKVMFEDVGIYRNEKGHASLPLDKVPS